MIYLSALPLLGRLYTPQDYGVYGVFVAILGVATILLSLRWELALVHQRTPEELRVFANSFFLVLLVTSGLLGALLLLSNRWMGETARVIGWFLIVSGPLACLYTLFELYCVKRNLYAVYFWARISKISLLVGVQLVFALILDKPTWTSLAFAHFFSLLMAPLLGVLLGNGKDVLWAMAPARPYEWSEIKTLFVRERGHLFVNGPQALVNSLGSTAPYVLLGAANVSVAGLYTMADRVVRAPLNLISSSIKQVVTNEIAEDQGSGRQRILILWALTAAGGIPVASLIFFSGELLFAFFLGDDWRSAGTIAGYLAIYAVGVLLNLPVLAALRALRAHLQILRIEIALLAVKLIGLGVGLHLVGPVGAVLIFAIASFVGYGVASVIGYLFVTSRSSHTLR